MEAVKEDSEEDLDNEHYRSREWYVPSAIQHEFPMEEWKFAPVNPMNPL